MKIAYYISILLIIITTYSKAQFNRSQFIDILNIKNTITDTINTDLSFFSDKGAWFAYALPDHKENYGSFIGPLLMEMDGKWLANSVAQLYITENGKSIDLTTAKVNNHYYPGLLKQEYTLTDFTIKIELLFSSYREAKIRTSITNITNHTKKISIGWKGQLLLNATKVNTTNNTIEINFTNNPYAFTITFETNKLLSININNKNYTAVINEIEISGGATTSIIQSQQYYPSKIEKERFVKTEVDFNNELIENEKRWNTYLNNYFSSTAINEISHQNLAVKSMMTLITNWRCAAGDLLHDGLFPSASYQGFYGFWSWDSWKQAVGLASFNTELAKSNILSMFDYQNDAGMIADCIYYQKNENNWRDTKAPLAAWAVLNIVKQTKDIQFIKEIYPKLVNYHHWWYTNRDHDHNGLCEFGSTDGSKIAAKWESGMDNALRFDKIEMLKNNETAWSIDKESVDLNAFLFKEKIYLSELATMIGQTSDAKKYQNQAEELKEKINDYFFNTEKGFYYDRQIGKKDFCIIEGCEGWTALWAEIPSKEQATQVMKMMTNTQKFNSYVPLPTLCIDAKGFDPKKGYWRGPVWLDQVYFGLDGIRKYGNETLYQQLKTKLIKNTEGLLNDLSIRENYHPLTGEGLNAKNFSWSAAHLLMILKP